MNKGVLKVDPLGDDPAEKDFDLAYYRSLTTEERFRMILERSILLRRLAEENATDPEPPALTKRL